VQQVTAALIEKKGRILLALRKPGKHMGPKWELPGGKVDPGEEPRQTLRRELKEEFGIEVRVGQYLGTTRFQSDRIDLEIFFFQVRHVAGTIVLREHEAIRWVEPAQVDDYDLVDSDRKLLREFREILT
jgi:8-oxo-dGTP diphosphatase